MAQYIVGNNDANEVNWMVTIITRQHNPCADDILWGNLLIESIRRCRKNTVFVKELAALNFEHRILTVLRIFAGQATVGQSSNVGLSGI